MYGSISWNLKTRYLRNSQNGRPWSKNLPGEKFKAIRTDNGGGFTSKEFETHLTAEGVRHKLTIPKNQEQNGAAERMNRALVETARLMLVNVNLPHRFWAEALSTATFLWNRSPTKAVCGMTPHEAWTGENHELTDSESLGVKPLYTYPTMRQLLEDLHNGQIEPTVICKTTSLLSALLGTPSITRGPNILILSIIMFERRSWTPLSSYNIVQWVTW